MRRNKRDFGRLILIAIFLFVAVLLPNLINAISRAAGTLGTFAAGETGIKLCATISGGNEDALRFNVTNNQGFQADVVVPADTCKNIHTEAATYHVRQYVSQEYAIDSVSGGTISADDTDFVATTSGQYSIVYANSYSQKPYLHNFGYTGSATASSAVEVTFDANGGTGTMAPQYFGLNDQQALVANAFTRANSNFNGWNTRADGTGVSYVDEQVLAFATGGELTLFAQWEFASRKATDIIAGQVNDLGDYVIDFTKKAIESADITTANGNGVNKYAENNTDIYYFRGQVNNNNVIWADKCWKIIRTTATGGTKIVYNGLPTDVVVDGNTVKQCNAADADSQIIVNIDGTDTNKIKFNNGYNSPADVGYMYGARITINTLSAGSMSFVFSNDVSKNGNTYTLDTSTGQSISGTWADERTNAAVKYHYFCTDGATSCDGSKIGYISYPGSNTIIYYLKVNGYNNIEDMKTAMFSNTIDSNAKTMVETWFEQQNLDGHETSTRNYEDDLEDTVFCNDRSYYSGTLKGKDSDATGTSVASYNNHGSYGRNSVKNSDGNFEPSLDCANSNDAFTKDSANGNGKLKHKIGLMTEDELIITGNGWNIQDAAAYLHTSQCTWSASPYHFDAQFAREYSWPWNGGINNVTYTLCGLRPSVSLKSGTEFANNGADGTTTNPYIVE